MGKIQCHQVQHCYLRMNIARHNLNQGNLSKGIDNWSGVALSVVQTLKVRNMCKMFYLIPLKNLIEN